MTEHPFRRLRSSIAFENPWFQVQEHEVEVVSSRRRFRYAYLSTSPSVMVVALTAEQKVVLVRQYRFPQDRYAYELPGGGTDGEAPRKAARKELEEETGYRAARLRKLGEFTVYCGLSDETCHVFLARSLRPGRQTLEESEHLTVHEVSFARLRSMMRRGEFRDGMGLAVLHIALPVLEKELSAAG